MGSSGGDFAADDTVRRMAHDIVPAKKAAPVFLLLALTSISACSTSSHEILGQTRTPLRSAEVRIYLEPVSARYQQIAVVAASSRGSFSWTARAKAEVVMQRLKAEAAKLGANAIVVEEITFAMPISAGAGLAPDLTRDHAALGVGFDASGLLSARYGRGLAIYLAPAAAAPAR